MLPELGLIALILALLLAVLLGSLPLVGAQRGIDGWIASARPLAFSQLALIGVAYAILTHAFVVHDFSVVYVATNSNTLLPAIYQVTAVWGAHEGSLLLWVLILALWIAAVAVFSKSLPDIVVARGSSFDGLLFGRRFVRGELACVRGRSHLSPRPHASDFRFAGERQFDGAKFSGGFDVEDDWLHPFA